MRRRVPSSSTGAAGIGLAAIGLAATRGERVDRIHEHLDASRRDGLTNAALATAAAATTAAATTVAASERT